MFGLSMCFVLYHSAKGLASFSDGRWSGFFPKWSCDYLTQYRLLIIWLGCVDNWRFEINIDVGSQFLLTWLCWRGFLCYRRMLVGEGARKPGKEVFFPSLFFFCRNRGYVLSHATFYAGLLRREGGFHCEQIPLSTTLPKYSVCFQACVKRFLPPIHFCGNSGAPAIFRLLQPSAITTTKSKTPLSWVD